MILVLAVHHVPGTSIQQAVAELMPKGIRRIDGMPIRDDYREPRMARARKVRPPQGVTAAVGKAAVWYTVTRPTLDPWMPPRGLGRPQVTPDVSARP